MTPTSSPRGVRRGGPASGLVLGLAVLVGVTACDPSTTQPVIDAEDRTISASMTGQVEREGAAKEHPEFQPLIAAGTVDDLTDGITATDVAETLVGPGVTISNVSYTGVDRSIGIFTDGSEVGLEGGIILSSGLVKDVVGPNSQPNVSVATGAPGDADLTALSGFPTFDAAVLEFDFEVPEFAERISMRYVFGSEEYNEWVGTQFNDVFAFFVNGENCATINGDPVSINTINNGANPNNQGNVIAPTNPEFYVNNDPFDPDISGAPLPDAEHFTEMDGFTIVLTCEADVFDDATNTMKIAIADASDRLFDSWVLLEEGSLTIIPLDVEKHWSETDVCFLRPDDPDACPEGTSLGTPLELDMDGAAQLEAVVRGGTVRSYNPGQVYAVSTVRVLGDIPALEIRELYDDCTDPFLQLNPAPGQGGGSVVVVVLDEFGEPVQILDAESSEVSATDGEAVVTLGPQEAGTTIMVYVKFGPSLRGEDWAGPYSCLNTNDAQAFDEEGDAFGELIAATAELVLSEKD